MRRIRRGWVGRPVNWLRGQSLRWPAVGLAAAAAAASTAGLAAVGAGPHVGASRLAIAAIAGAGIGTAAAAAVVGRLLRPVYDLRRAIIALGAGRLDVSAPVVPAGRELIDLARAFDRTTRQLRAAKVDADAAHTLLAARTAAVDRLLDFSQTIQGAGKPQQIIDSLAHFLRTELSLAGVVVMSLDPESAGVPQPQVRAVWPAELAAAGPTEIEPAECPCLRQNLPKLFACENSPVRCGIDRMLAKPAAAEHPAYCVPFAVREAQFVVHMLLPVGRTWDDDARQLAQAYVNAAHSTLMNLHQLAEAERQSMTDALTGLYNRRSLDSLVEREVALAERHGHPLSLAMLDLDRFKVINDEHGHAAGDHLLRTFADCVRMTLRKTDLAFRYGGDEFCIVLPQTPAETARQVVEKLRQAFTAVDFADAIAKLAVQPTLSIGVVERSKAANVLTLPQLTAAADAALYEAKRVSRDCVAVYTPPRAA